MTRSVCLCKQSTSRGKARLLPSHRPTNRCAFQLPTPTMRSRSASNAVLACVVHLVSLPSLAVWDQARRAERAAPGPHIPGMRRWRASPGRAVRVGGRTAGDVSDWQSQGWYPSLRRSGRVGSGERCEGLCRTGQVTGALGAWQPAKIVPERAGSQGQSRSLADSRPFERWSAIRAQASRVNQDPCKQGIESPSLSTSSHAFPRHRRKH